MQKKTRTNPKKSFFCYENEEEKAGQTESEWTVRILSEEEREIETDDYQEQ